MVRAVQGRKTDRIDARRIAEYLPTELLQSSFIPRVGPMRKCAHMRVPIQQVWNRVINRIGRWLDTANIKLASVVSGFVSKCGRAMLDLLAAGRAEVTGTMGLLWYCRKR